MKNKMCIDFFVATREAVKFPFGIWKSSYQGGSAWFINIFQLTWVIYTSGYKDLLKKKMSLTGRRP